jgi:exopolysaccharide biosynthesis polyprenyl glycosylphosphotransferase
MLPKTRTIQIWKTVAFAVTDFLFLNLGIGVVYLYRFRYYPSLFDSSQRLSALEYFEFNLFFSILVITVFAFLGVYEIHRKKPWTTHFFNISLGISLVVFGLISFFFFFEFDRKLFPFGIPISRFVLFFAGFSSLLAILVGRLMFWLCEKILQAHNIGTTKVAIVGSNNQDFLKYIKTQSHINGVLIFPNLNLEILNTLQLKMLNQEISEVYIADHQNIALESRLAWFAERYKVGFIFAPAGFSHFQYFDLRPKRINRKLFLEVLHSKLDGWRVVFKRLFDIAFASCFLVFFSPIYLLIALSIWLEDRGPVFYLSDRVGPNGDTFKLWKFRRLKYEFCTSSTNDKAMKYENQLILERDIRKDGVLYKIQNDPRSTRVGRFIEKTSLDELPQFINVLNGSLSVVGPRPHQPREVAKYQNEHYKVLNIKPGITGMAQISGRSDLKFDKEVELDCWYIENWSFWLDVVIIIKTPSVLLGSHKG